MWIHFLQSCGKTDLAPQLFPGDGREVTPVPVLLSAASPSRPTDPLSGRSCCPHFTEKDTGTPGLGVRAVIWTQPQPCPCNRAQSDRCGAPRTSGSLRAGGESRGLPALVLSGACVSGSGVEGRNELEEPVWGLGCCDFEDRARSSVPMVVAQLSPALGLQGGRGVISAVAPTLVACPLPIVCPRCPRGPRFFS